VLNPWATQSSKFRTWANDPKTHWFQALPYITFVLQDDLLRNFSKKITQEIFCTFNFNFAYEIHVFACNYIVFLHMCKSVEYEILVHVFAFVLYCIAYV